MTTKPRRPLGERPVRVEVSEKLVKVRQHTLALAAFTDLDGPLPTELFDDEPVSGSTTFEEITCVGLTPSMDQLTAVVRIHANTGYSGPLCAGGSTEHVRFYVSTDDGVSWTDAGTDSFAVHDTPGQRPLDHAVDVVTPLRHTLCFVENHPIVRAVLSWNVAPPPNSPSWSPPWGNIVEVRVRPRTRRFPVLHDLVEAGAVKVSKALAATLVLDTPVTITPAASPSVAELAQTYAKAQVPAHRFALPAYLAATATGVTPPAAGPPVAALKAGGAFGGVLTQIDVSAKDFLAELSRPTATPRSRSSAASATTRPRMPWSASSPSSAVRATAAVRARPARPSTWRSGSTGAAGGSTWAPPRPPCTTRTSPTAGCTTPSTTRSGRGRTGAPAPTGRCSRGCARSCRGSRRRRPATPTGDRPGATARRPPSSSRPVR